MHDPGMWCVTAALLVLLFFSSCSSSAQGRHATPLWHERLPAAPSGKSASIVATGVLRDPAGNHVPLFGVSLFDAGSGELVSVAYGRGGVAALGSAANVSNKADFVATSAALCWVNVNYQGTSEWGCFRPAFDEAAEPSADVWRRAMSPGVVALIAAPSSGSVVGAGTAWLSATASLNRTALSVDLVNTASLGGSDYRTVDVPQRFGEAPVAWYASCRPEVWQNATSTPTCNLALAPNPPQRVAWEVVLGLSPRSRPITLTSPFENPQFLAAVRLDDATLVGWAIANDSALAVRVNGVPGWSLTWLGPSKTLGMCHGRWWIRATTSAEGISDVELVDLLNPSTVKLFETKGSFVAAHVFCDVGLGSSIVAAAVRTSAKRNVVWSIDLNKADFADYVIFLPFSASLCDAAMGLLVVCDVDSVTVYNATNSTRLYSIGTHGMRRRSTVALVAESHTLFVVADGTLYAYDALDPTLASTHGPESDPSTTADSAGHPSNGPATAAASGVRTGVPSSAVSTTSAVIAGSIAAAVLSAVMIGAYWGARRVRLRRRRRPRLDSRIVLLQDSPDTPQVIENCVEESVDSAYLAGPPMAVHGDGLAYSGVERQVATVKTTVLTQYPLKSSLGL